jgi:uncharacterized membrane protein YccC
VTLRFDIAVGILIALLATLAVWEARERYRELQRRARRVQEDLRRREGRR